MARSGYIYIVAEANSGVPVGAFTVKHEMVGALRKSGLIGKVGHAVVAYRIPDGRISCDKVYYSKEELNK